MRHLGNKVRAPRQRAVSLLLAALAMGCSRTGLEQPRDLAGGAGREAGVGDGASPRPTSGPDEPPPVDEPTARAHCTPSPETCNGKDDDCNGSVDDGIPAVACPGGGKQYCVAGRLSQCPTRCDACIPGSERVCFHSYCTFWATESCAADGKSFGACRESHVPPECAGVAERNQESPELEQCCIDNGYCCHDEFDLDHDGNRSEMLGTCDEVSCTP